MSMSLATGDIKDAASLRAAREIAYSEFKKTQVIGKLTDIYGFSAAELEDFKQNWVTVQNR